MTLILLALIVSGCQRSLDDLEPAEFPKNPNVFINEFSGGLNYAAFGGSVPTAFQVDTEVTRNNISTASMRFEVPDVNDPRGAYAGGSYFTEVGRNLTEYDALTFWIKATKAANIDIIGFGNDLGESKFQASISGLPVNTNWQKVILPIPDPSKLTAEKGMLFYSEGPEDGKGYTFWIDEVKFEKLGTLANPRAVILGGQENTVNAEIGERVPITGMQFTSNLPTGVDRTMDIASGYFEFTSSDPTVASVENGFVTVLSAGTSEISATLGSIVASGSMIINSTGQVEGPDTRAPIPNEPADKVISMYTNVYPNVPVDTWNTRWEFSTAEEFFINVQGDDVIRYRNLNFVGIEFASQTIDASEMTHFHLNIWTPDNTNPPNSFKVLLVDFGADNAFGGGDDSSHEITITRPTLVTEGWVTIDVPLSSFSGLQNRANLAQLVLSGDLPNIYLTNVYFYDDDSGGGGETMPTVAAPTPTTNAADVISLFSDAYEDVAVDTWRTDWSAAVLADVQVAGNPTKLYTNLDFVGIETVANQIDISGMTHFRMDVWSPNYTFFAIKLVDFGPDGAFGGGDDTEHQIDIEMPGQSSWVSLDIPITDFVNLQNRQNIAQLILVGQPTGASTVYVDNVYFKK